MLIFFRMTDYNGQMKDGFLLFQGIFLSQFKNPEYKCCDTQVGVQDARLYTDNNMVIRNLAVVQLWSSIGVVSNFLDINPTFSV
jgi:hypothetical protein